MVSVSITKLETIPIPKIHPESLNPKPYSILDYLNNVKIMLCLTSKHISIVENVAVDWEHLSAGLAVREGFAFELDSITFFNKFVKLEALGRTEIIIVDRAVFFKALENVIAYTRWAMTTARCDYWHTPGCRAWVVLKRLFRIFMLAMLIAVWWFINVDEFVENWIQQKLEWFFESWICLKITNIENNVIYSFKLVKFSFG